MELASGGDLFDRIVARGSYVEADASRVVRELCEALAHVHQRAIVHRDLKPENILCASVDEDAPVKITDFGLATRHVIERETDPGESVAATARSPSPVSRSHSRQALRAMASPVIRRRLQRNGSCQGSSTERSVAASAEPLSPSSLRHSTPTTALKLTNSSTQYVGRRAHRLVGTPSYMAPEVLVQAMYGPACDMWAVGVILYFSLCGQPPFIGHQDLMLEYIRTGCYDHCEGPEWEAVSDEAKDLIRRLLVMDPRARLTAAAALEHPWIRDGLISRSASFRLPPDGLAKLATHREATKLSSPLKVMHVRPEQPPHERGSSSPQGLRRTESGATEGSSHGGSSFIRRVSFANETWR